MTSTPVLGVRSRPGPGMASRPRRAGRPKHLTDEWNDRHDPVEAERMFRAAAADDYAVRPLWAGDGLDLIASIEAPETIVLSIVTEAAQRIMSSSQLVVATTARHGGVDL